MKATKLTALVATTFLSLSATAFQGDWKSELTHEEGTFAGVDRIRLYYQVWSPNPTPKALVILVHGGGDHSGRYRTVVEALGQQRFAVAGFDLRGNGKSPGIRGKINNWNEYRQDLGLFIKFMRQKDPSLPVFLYGHSLGGLIVLEFLLHDPGVVCVTGMMILPKIPCCDNHLGYRGRAL